MEDKAKQQYILTLGRQLFKEILNVPTASLNPCDSNLISKNSKEVKIPIDFDDKVQFLKDKRGGSLSSLILKFISQLTQQHQLKLKDFKPLDQQYLQSNNQISSGLIGKDVLQTFLNQRYGIQLDDKQIVTIIRFFKVEDDNNQESKEQIDYSLFNY